MPDLDYRRPICVSHDPPVNMQPERNGVIVRLSADRLIVVVVLILILLGALR